MSATRIARGCTAAASVALAMAAMSTSAAAQSREPLCATTASRRLLAGPSLTARAGDRVLLEALGGQGAARFVLAVRDGRHTLRAGDAVSLARGADELGYARTAAPSRTGGLVVLRLDAALRAVGEPEFLADPVAAGDDTASDVYAPSLTASARVANGAVLLEILSGALYATAASSAGPVAQPTRIAQPPAPAEPSARVGFTWVTAVARGEGAIALAGTGDGQVVSLRFDRAGALASAPSPWTQRVGGPLQLLPTPEGPATALLARPVRGTGPRNEQARVQVLVPLADDLRPTGDPFATGFAQFPVAAVARGRTLTLMQWVQQQGVAIASLPVGERRIGESLPRVWYAQPPLEGEALGQAAVLGAGNIVYDVVLYGPADGAAVHGHIGWLAPASGPIVRRGVLPLRTRLFGAPAALAAEDGVVAVTAGEDETGGAVDAFHVRCELVTAETHE